jgi:hypothetical protein
MFMPVFLTRQRALEPSHVQPEAGVAHAWLLFDRARDLVGVAHARHARRIDI